MLLFQVYVLFFHCAHKLDLLVVFFCFVLTELLELVTVVMVIFSCDLNVGHEEMWFILDYQPNICFSG